MKENKKSFQPKQVTFDLTEFDVLLKSQVNLLPEKVLEKYQIVSEFLENSLKDGQSIHIVIPKSNEVYIGSSENIDYNKLDALGSLIYDFVVNDKQLPSRLGG